MSLGVLIMNTCINAYIILYLPKGFQFRAGLQDRAPLKGCRCRYRCNK